MQEHDYDYMENILMEERGKCSDEYHSYGFEYITGNTIENIGDVELRLSYADSKEESKVKHKQLKAVLVLEKEFYKKKLEKAENNKPQTPS